MKRNFCWFLISTFLISIKCENEEGPTISTTQGDIKGTWKTTVNGRTIQAFMGIPYAKPPVGSLRFKDPEPYGSWSAVRDGTKDPSVCPQPDWSKPGGVTGDEDCLYLNVYTPETSNNGTLPVMVFIHGGSFVAGGCLSDMYGPDLLLDKDIVLVAINYRIGILGFGSTEDDEIPGNFGLKDQVMALKWVQENIASYGGNPDSVTIFGICSGGVSVHFHMLSPLSKDLFHRGISMSGKAYDPWAISAPGTAEKYLIKSGELLNCSTSTSKALRNCLSNLPVSSLVNVGRNFFVWVGMDPSTVFTPVLESKHEGNFITLESFMSHSSLPMMSGVTSEEGAQKVAQFHHSPAGVDKVLKLLDDDFVTIAPFSLGFEDKADDPSEVALKIKEYFFKNKPINKEAIPELVQMYSDAYYYEGAKSAIQKHDGPLFLYMFGYDGEHSLTEASSGVNFRHGVAHADDLQYLFPMGKIVKRPNGLSPEDKKTSKQLITYLTNFAETSNPTPNGELIEWTPMTTEDHNYLIINGSNTRMENNFLMERDDFWKSTNWLNKLFPESE